jgi:hypothetical protein
MAYSDNCDSSEKSDLEENDTLRLHRTLKSSFRMEIEQRILIKYLRFKGMKLFDTGHKFVLAFDKKAYIYASVKH